MARKLSGRFLAPSQRRVARITFRTIAAVLNLANITLLAIAHKRIYPLPLFLAPLAVALCWQLFEAANALATRDGRTRHPVIRTAIDVILWIAFETVGGLVVLKRTSFSGDWSRTQSPIAISALAVWGVTTFLQFGLLITDFWRLVVLSHDKRLAADESDNNPNVPQSISAVGSDVTGIGHPKEKAFKETPEAGPEDWE